MKSKLIALAAVAIASATGVNAQSAFDGTIGLTYLSAPDDSYDYVLQGNGSLVYHFTPTFGVQADLGGTSYSFPTSTSSYMHYGLHGIYALSSATNIGLYFAQDLTKFGLVNSTYLGAEASHRSGNFGLEAFAGKEYIAMPAGWFLGSQYSWVGAKASYQLNPIGSMLSGVTVYAGLTNRYKSGGSTSITNEYAGFIVPVGNNVQFDARAAAIPGSSTYHYYSLGVVYNFGRGAVFTPRDFYSSLPGY